MGASDAEYDAYATWSVAYAGDVRDALDEQIELMLTPREYQAWARYVKDLLVLHLDYAQPLRIER